MTRWRLTLGVVLAALALGVASLGWPGGVESYDETGRHASAGPAWTAACWLHEPRKDRTLLARCAKLRGRVVYVKRERENGRLRETHLAVLAHYRIVLVKVWRPHSVDIPAVGTMITAIGPLVRARNGMREIQAWRLVQ